jgi:NAD(P)-dependent dehydrogenase (short-subunit alcohol dehydrogenase family)
MRMLEGKVAVVSGGTSGIGARAAELFVAQGARLVIGGRRRQKGEELARSLGNNASFIRVDVSIEADVKAMIEKAIEQFGRLDCLFNNAGIPSQRADLADLDLKQFDEAMAIHVRGTLAGIKYAAPVMTKEGSGSIINMASINGFRAGFAIDYSVAKAAVIHLTRCAAVELGEKGIRVNCLSPGPIATGIFGKAAGLAPDAADLTIEAAEAAIAEVLPRWQPLPHPGVSDDIAQSALFLASDMSRHINGHNLVVDGGMSVGWPAAVVRNDLTEFRKAFQVRRSSQAE